jgi:hypothetical protein
LLVEVQVEQQQAEIMKLAEAVEVGVLHTQQANL